MDKIIRIDERMKIKEKERKKVKRLLLGSILKDIRDLNLVYACDVVRVLKDRRNKYV